MHVLSELATSDLANRYSDQQVWLSSLFWYVVTAVGLWPMLVKAGIPGWGALIPIYNIYLQVKLAGHSGWLTLLYFVPLVNLVVAIVVAVGLARAFGRGAVYGFFLHFLLQPIGFLITGFGPSQYAYVHRWSPAR